LETTFFAFNVFLVIAWLALSVVVVRQHRQLIEREDKVNERVSA
jgi:hypothetical protein